MSALSEFLFDKSVLILGFGREGRSTYSYIRKYLPDKPLCIADRADITVDDANVTTLCGEDYLKSINSFDVVFKSPGIPFLDVDISEDTLVTCQLDMFLRYAVIPVIGITGTKGKTTTSSLIHAMLTRGGLKAKLLGNMGLPVLDELDDTDADCAVIEMSSHQLEFTRRSPHIAVLVNVYEEHLDHYRTGYDGYVNSKLNITRFQGKNDSFIYDPEQEIKGFADITPFIGGEIVPVRHSEVMQSEFIASLMKETSVLKGEHNAQDVAYAAAAARIMGVGDDAVTAAIKDFRGIEHRMELVGEYSGIIFYNDSIATIPAAVMGAVRALEKVDTLILGGLDRGIDYGELEDFIVKSSISNIIGLPETGHMIIEGLKSRGTKKMLLPVKNMEEAVELAYARTAKGRICLFSPAAASYNYYKNFEEKGRHFKSLVVGHTAGL